ncbi:hypothetical protein BIFANG_03641 [Bifidobacterium angulatum DSM 20098 = JCM 7096]|uniref:Uncharacterized protein n=1 Tax=Bifidobacterium angulatum DSM 20098 = JCM 7096 TaxID=518635 RepID=C4FH10_9BIFI|nr:hypothetical protein BIFANG_03641 [Bifidobacterium angulatum DSM 20098 = JCM 7096]
MNGVLDGTVKTLAFIGAFYDILKGTCSRRERCQRRLAKRSQVMCVVWEER